MHNAALALSSNASVKPSLKRRYTSPENSDSENVDPESIKSAVKRKCVGESSVNTLKHDADTSYSVITKPQVYDTRSRLTEPVKATPKPTKSTTSAPTPIPTGRSTVKSKRGGLLSTRRTSSGSLQYTRLDTPVYGRTRAPFSLATALNGTFSKSKRRDVSTIEESMPKSWVFDIHEDTEEEHNRKEKEQNIAILGRTFSEQDISDDEGNSTYDQREKENIPPGMVVTSTVERNELIPASRKNMMTDEPRAPLGNLNAADYYGEGCDATSFVLVAADDVPVEKCSTDQHIATAQCNVTGTEDSFLDKASLDSLIAESAPPKPEEEPSMNDEMNDGFGFCGGGSIEIWESGSAKDEAEAVGERTGESIFAV